MSEYAIVIEIIEKNQLMLRGVKCNNEAKTKSNDSGLKMRSYPYVRLIFRRRKLWWLGVCSRLDSVSLSHI